MKNRVISISIELRELNSSNDMNAMKIGNLANQYFTLMRKIHNQSNDRLSGEILKREEFEIIGWLTRFEECRESQYYDNAKKVFSNAISSRNNV